jgi:uncharacterized membrane protein YoaK (UPF0700 family)
MNESDEKKPSACGSKMSSWLGIPLGAVVGIVAGAVTANFALWVPIGVVLGLLFSFGLRGGT